MIKKDLTYFQEKLEKEKLLLEEELKTVGHKNAHSAGGWEATPSDTDVNTADENEVADKFEELDDNNAILTQLEKQLIEVNDALSRIENGTYGICEKTGEPIDRARLEANPSARTNI